MDGWDGRLSPAASLLRAPYGANKSIWLQCHAPNTNVESTDKDEKEWLGYGPETFVVTDEVRKTLFCSIWSIGSSWSSWSQTTRATKSNTWWSQYKTRTTNTSILKLPWQFNTETKGDQMSYKWLMIFTKLCIFKEPNLGQIILT